MLVIALDIFQTGVTLIMWWKWLAETCQTITISITVTGQTITVTGQAITVIGKTITVTSQTITVTSQWLYLVRLLL